MLLRRLADTGTNFLVVPQQVADNAASILNGPMEQLTGVSGFFYGNSMTCVSGFTREEVDNALPALEFAIPDVDGNITVVSVVLTGRARSGMCDPASTAVVRSGGGSWCLCLGRQVSPVCSWAPLGCAGLMPSMAALGGPQALQ